MLTMINLKYKHETCNHPIKFSFQHFKLQRGMGLEFTLWDTMGLPTWLLLRVAQLTQPKVGGIDHVLDSFFKICFWRYCRVTPKVSIPDCKTDADCHGTHCFKENPWLNWGSCDGKSWKFSYGECRTPMDCPPRHHCLMHQYLGKQYCHAYAE